MITKEKITELLKSNDLSDNYYGLELIKKSDIKIKRKDPLFYVRFETPEKINLQEFRANSKIEKLAAECAFATHYIKTNKLSKIYNLFINRKLQTPILKEIKKNLV